MNRNATTTRPTRRSLLRAGALTATSLAFPTIIPSRVLGKDGAISPSNRTALGVIGFGPRCTTVLGAMLAEPDVQCLTLCDVQSIKRQAGKVFVDSRYDNADCTTTADFRELLARTDIDAVLIATGDRWHTVASVLAAKAGKDVYSEKPCAMTIVDCQRLADTMQRCGRVFQAGTQRRSIGNFRLAVELAHSGKLGKLHTLHASVYRPKLPPRWLPEEPQPTADVCDWDLWLGPAPWRPYNRKYVQGGWRGHDDFDSGYTLLDWGAHTVDLCQWANRSDDTMPVEYVPSDASITATYANGVKLVLDFLDTPFGNRDPHYRTHTGTCPVRFEGSEGWVETGDNGVVEVSSDALRNELRHLRTSRIEKGTDAHSHGRNFFDCIRTRRPTNANPTVMRHSHIACHAAATAWRLGRKLTLDPATETFINDEEANRLRSRAYREPWRV